MYPKAGPRYAPVPEDEPSSSFEGHEEHTLLSEKFMGTKQSRKHSLSTRLFIALGVVIAITLYSAVLLTLSSLWWSKQRLHGAEVIDTPLRPFLNYEATTIHMGEESKDYELMGMPSDQLDDAWERLMKDFWTDAPRSYVEKVGRLDEAIPTERGGFLATYSFMHQIHCLKRLHHSYFPDRYFPNTTEHEKANLLEHNLHCLQMLLKAIQCHADPVPETLRWVEESKFPLGNRTSPHECVNWDMLMAEMKRHRIDPFKPGALVHPKFGAVVPDGRNTVIDDNDRHRFVINGTSVRVPVEGR